jgi:GntR family trehalose operon transcriptional repressor
MVIARREFVVLSLEIERNKLFFQGGGAMPASKYHEIYEDLRSKIESGQYAYNSYLPSEYNLIEEYDCSRNTVRRAIAKLADEGYVQSMHGKGVLVLWMPAQPSLFSFGGIETMKEAANRNGMVYRTKIIRFEEIVVDRELAKRTGFEPGQEVYAIVRARCFDNEALIIDHNWFLKSVVRDLTPRIAENSIYEHIETTLGETIMTTLRKLTVERKTEMDQKYMDLRDYNCVVVVTSHTYNSTGVMFEYTESRHRPDRFVFYNQAKRARR